MSQLNTLMLVAAVGAGIFAGARLSRITSVSKMVMLQLLTVGAMGLAVHFVEGFSLVLTETALASMLAAWIARKTVPKAESQDRYGGFGINHGPESTYGSPASNPMKVRPEDNPFERRSTPRLFDRILKRKPMPHRMTPTGNRIKLVSSTDISPGKARGTLIRVK